MPITRSRVVALLAATSLLVLVVVTPASAQRLKQPGAAKALRTLVKQTNALPAAAAPTAKRRRLASAARSARRTARTRPCASVRQLARYRKLLRGIRVRKGRRGRRAANRLKALGPASMNASRALLAKRRTRRCGGGVKPSRLESARFRILRSATGGMRLRVRMPALRFVDATGGGRTWTRLVLPKTDSPGRPGTPGIPVVAGVLGVPEGASLDVDATRTTSYTIRQVDVFPNQREPVDQAGIVTPPPNFEAPPFASPPFELSRAAYRRRGSFPRQAADGAVLGRSRDITLGSLRIPAARYDARTKTLKVLNTVDVSVRFEGGSHQFSRQLGSPWERPQRSLIGSLLNSDAIRLVPPVTDLEGCGEEMLVITNPSTIAPANQFAAARQAAGLRTTVAQTGGAPGQIGSTTGEIQAYIRSRLTAEGCIHPSYVTIFGDDELVPTFPGIGGIESDLEYSLRDGADELPDVALGRIVGDDAASLSTAVTKIVNYETSPPSGSWLRRASIAAEFQDDEAPDNQEDRTFITFAEVTRTGILNTPGGTGLTVDRLYADYPPGGVDPMRFNDGTDLPAFLKKPTFGWDASTADIAAAWNGGRYLMVHRGHGWPDGWDNPRFSSADADALTNGAMLPVVLSINCSSGAFQDDDTAFATQALVNPNGGAVGVFGDTEISPTWHNTQIAWGFMDALLPRVLAGEGPAERRRVGEALVHGKSRLAAISPPTADGNTRNELYLWHYFGDPSMQMWGGDPIEIPDPSRFRAIYKHDFTPGPPIPDPPPYAVEVVLPPAFNGQAISLLRGGQVIGKAIAADGRAEVPAQFGDDRPGPGELEVAMEADGALPVKIPVEDVPVETTLTTTCPPFQSPSEDPMVTSGTLQPGFEGAKVVVRYTPPAGAGQPFERTVTTDAKGNWSDSIVPSDDGSGGTRPGRGAGTWRIEPRFEGDAGHRASSGPACQPIVFDSS